MFHLHISVDTAKTPKREYAAHVLEQIGNQYESITVWHTKNDPFNIHLEGRSTEIIEAMKKFEDEFPEVAKEADRAALQCCVNRGIHTTEIKRIA